LTISFVMGEAGFHRDRTEENLEIGVGEAEGALVEEGAQGLDAGLSDVAVELHAQRLRIDQVALVSLVYCALNSDWGEFGRKVDERLHGGRHWNAVI
jgi:hypothetical protein